MVRSKTNMEVARPAESIQVPAAASGQARSQSSTHQVSGPQIVGRCSATDRNPSTSEKFHFWLAPDVIANPFDIVEVEQVHPEAGKSSLTYGLITSIDHITDAPSHLSNFISNNFGQVEEVPNTPRMGTSIAHVNVLSNTDEIYMPVPNERPVRFATEEGIQKALGMDVLIKDQPNRAIPAGIIKLTSGQSAVAYLDRHYVLGPESAHVNISGISGLATKTSYAMFLIQSILQKAPNPDEIAVVILNVKADDLLHIDQPRLPLKDKEREAAFQETWEAAGLKPVHFDPKKTHFFLPKGHGLDPNAHVKAGDIPKAMIYAYDLAHTADRLELLFATVPDTYSTLESIIGEVQKGLGDTKGKFKNVSSFDQLLTGEPLVKDGAAQPLGEIKVSSVGVFLRHMRRLIVTRSSGLFVRGALSIRQKVLSEELRKIKGGHTYVVDIAKLHDEEQTLVFGDIIRTLYKVKAEGSEDEQGSLLEGPEKILVFVDELNKYAPSGRQSSPIVDQVLEIAERGRSLGVILISAQQFMSAVHSRVTGNSATKVLGRAGSAEISTSDYRFLPDELKSSLTRLAKGELLLSHAIYRQPVKIAFPLPAYKQPGVK